MDDVALEHRLTKLEEAAVSTRSVVEEGFDTIRKQLERQQATNDRILVQTTKTNNRVTKLEEGILGPEEAKVLLEQHRDLWSVWRFSRWFVPISIPLTIGMATLAFEIIKHYG